MYDLDKKWNAMNTLQEEFTQKWKTFLCFIHLHVVSNQYDFFFIPHNTNIEFWHIFL